MVEDPNHLPRWGHSNNTDHRENGHPSRYPHQKTGFSLASVPLSSAYRPASLVELFLLSSSLSLFFLCFFNAISGLGVLFKLLSIHRGPVRGPKVWLASTFVQGSKPGEDQGPRRRQRAALISTVLSYRAWNRFFFFFFFLNDNDQTSRRFSFHFRLYIHVSSPFLPPWISLRPISGPSPPFFFPRGTVRRRSIKPAENACACNPICKYFHGSTPLNRGD